MQTPIYHVIPTPTPYATPVFPVTMGQRGHADIIARYSLEGGEETVYLAPSWSPGIKRVYFENGPVPGSGEYQWMLDEQLRNQDAAPMATRTEEHQSAAPATKPNERKSNVLVPDEEQKGVIEAFGGGHWENDGNGNPFFVPPAL